MASQGQPPDPPTPRAAAADAGERYQIRALIGEGASKRVHLAWDPALKREVAWCEFKSRSLSASDLRRIRREAQTLASLEHPNIVAIYELDGAGRYFVAELMRGGSLKQLLTEQGEDTPAWRDRVLRIALQIADALAHTHAQAIFHRDVKPSNVFLDAAGNAKLGDFGLARPLNDAVSLNEPGVLVGTLAYMAPEQVEGDLPDSPADMWSFGVMLYEMVAGRRPFTGDDAAVLTAISHLTPKVPEHFAPGCPAALSALVMALLSKHPEGRPTAAETADRLRALLGHPVAAVPTDGGARRSRLWRGVAISAPLVAVLLYVAVDAFFQRDTETLEALPVDGHSERGTGTLDALPTDGLSAHDGVALEAVPIDALCWLAAEHSPPLVGGSPSPAPVAASPPAAVDALRARFRSAPGNAALLAHIQALRVQLAATGSAPGLTYVHGEPGVGKSFVLIHELKASLAKDALCTLDLARVLVERPPPGLRVSQRPDLTSLDGRVVLNRLPAIDPPGDFQPGTLWQTQASCMPGGRPAQVVVLDALDEIHPDTARLLLRSLEEGALQSAVIVMGRSEGFTPWTRDSRRQGGRASFYALSGPTYRTDGDVALLARNVYAWKHGAARWQQMHENGEAQAKVEGYVNAVRRHPFLAATIATLSGAVTLRDHLDAASAASPRALKAELLQAALERALSKHRRPVHLVPAFAALAARHAQTDAEGYFTVAADQRVALPGATPGTLDVRTLLDRSGLVVSRPEGLAARYRFAPRWQHPYLVELHNETKVQGHRFRDCP